LLGLLLKLVAGILDIFGSIASIMNFGGKTLPKARSKDRKIPTILAGNYLQSLAQIKKEARNSCDSIWLLRSFSPSAGENQQMEQVFREMLAFESPPTRIHRNLYLDLSGTPEEILNGNAVEHVESLIEILGRVEGAEVRYFSVVSFVIDLCIIDNRVLFIGMSEGGEHIRDSIIIHDAMDAIGFFRDAFSELWKRSELIFKGEPARGLKDLELLRHEFRKRIKQIKDNEH